MNQFLVASGNREVMEPLSRELFFDIENKNLYIWWIDHWVLIGGPDKQNYLEAGDNIEFTFDPDDKYGFKPTVRLKDDIDIDTWILGKLEDIDLKYKGLYFLGRVEQCSFFPLVEYSTISLGTGLGGCIVVRISREGVVESSVYRMTVHSNKNFDLMGTDKQHVTLKVAKANIQGTSFIGLKTYNISKRMYMQGKEEAPPDFFEVWFSGWDYRENVPNLNIAENDIQSIEILNEV